MSTSPPVPLKLLLVEDQEDDAFLLTRHLGKGGYALDTHRVWDAPGLRRALAADTYDLILSDFSMPGFSGLMALQMVKEAGLDTPFMVVSGSIGEDTAVQLMLGGASDYIMKDNLTRLLPAVARELNEARQRAERRAMQKNLELVQRLTSGVTGEDFFPALTAQLAGALTAARVYVVRLLPGPAPRGEVLSVFPAQASPAQTFDLPEEFYNALKTGQPVLHPADAPQPFGPAVGDSFMAAPFLDETQAPLGYLVVEKSVAATPNALSLSTLDILAARAGAELKRLRMTEDLRLSQERFELAVKAMGDGLWDWNILTGEVYYSPRWKELMGLAEHPVSDSIIEWLGRVHPDERDALREDLEAHLKGVLPHFEREHRVLHRSGSYRWMTSRALAARDENGEPRRMVGSATDITMRKKAEQQIMHDAFHDGLTTLPNRALLLERLTQALRHAAQKRRGRVAVMVLDLDRFQLINDSLGHLWGDQLLIAAARRFEQATPTNATLARLGGDEFALLLDETRSEKDAQRMAEKLLTSLAEPFALADQEVRLSASVGVALCSGQGMGAEELLRNADLAMYQAKATGKAKCVVFDPGLHTQAMHRLRLETDLRRALEREELAVAFQPIVHLQSGAPTGFEALVRWHHPEQGLLMPGQFIPLAEETGLVIPLGLVVLRLATMAMQQWRLTWPHMAEWTVAVNLSARQVGLPSLAQEVRRVLTESGLPPKNLRLEITESVLLENAHTAASLLQELKAMGVKISLDDFGTGYSSLHYLHQLPIDTLKMDGVFTRSLQHPAQGGHITRTILELGRNLGMRVVAEGIETREQCDHLLALGCELGQGFFLAEPMMEEDVTQRLTQGQSLVNPKAVG